MSFDVEVIHTGVLFGEGPVWCDDGTVVCTGVADGMLHRVWPDTGHRQVLATTFGGPNAAAPMADGGFVVTQNGGIDFSIHQLPGLEDLPPLQRRRPSIQRVAPDGTVSEVTTGYQNGSPFLAPNDLVSTGDGHLYVTDPGHHPLPPEPAGRVFRVRPDGVVEPVAGPFHYCNGIALDHRGELLVVEANGLVKVSREGEAEWLIEDLGTAGDGFAVDVVGNVYVCSPGGSCIYVVDADGQVVDTIAMPAPGMVTNCCFGGEDGRTLYVTLALAEALGVIEGLPHPGVSVHPWPGIVG